MRLLYSVQTSEVDFAVPVDVCLSNELLNELRVGVAVNIRHDSHQVICRHNAFALRVKN